MTWHDALDLQYWFVNALSGSADIFTFLAFIAIACMAAYFRMLNSVTLVMFILFGALMVNYVQGMYYIMILLVGIILAYLVSRILSKS